jgi:hypothetical protein
LTTAKIQALNSRKKATKITSWSGLWMLLFDGDKPEQIPSHGIANSFFRECYIADRWS